MSMGMASYCGSIEDRLKIAQSLIEKVEEVSEPSAPCSIQVSCSDRSGPPSPKRPAHDACLPFSSGAVIAINTEHESEGSTQCLGERAASSGDRRGLKIKVELPSNRPKGSGKQKQVFRYGNYDRYYGKRTPSGSEDERLQYMDPSWFRKKCCLDIGCNVGRVTYAIAKDFEPARIVGIDIDGHLISVARKNIRHYLRGSEVRGTSNGKARDFGRFKPDGRFKGPPTGNERFPHNIGFVTGNYVGDDDSIVATSRPEYDTILCLSVTKWVHLNFGDEGLMRLFKRAFRQLKPGGRFILEPQLWESYSKAKKIAADLKERYKQLQIRPDHFPDILVHEVGFQKLDQMAWPAHNQPGFSRPIQIYYKAAGDLDLNGKN